MSPIDFSAADLDLYLQSLFGIAPRGSLIELRWRTERGMSQRFLPAGQLDAVAAEARWRSPRTDVYVGVLPRLRQRGDRSSLTAPGRVAWVDLDRDDAVERLRSAPVPPAHLIVGSGSGGHAHAYWRLEEPQPLDTLEALNRQLAHGLGGDAACADAARILRPAGTVNHKHSAAVTRVLSLGDGAAVASADLVRGLPHLVDDVAAASREPRSGRSDGDPLMRVPPARYVQVLTGQVVPRSWKIRCPLHEDHTPSLHVYEAPEDGWFCFGCRRGGTVYDLAAGVWGMETRGAGFVQLRGRLVAELGVG